MYLGVKHKVKMVHIGSIDIYHPNILLLKKVIIFLMMLFFQQVKNIHYHMTFCHHLVPGSLSTNYK